MDGQGRLVISLFYRSVEFNDHLLVTTNGNEFSAEYWTSPEVTGYTAVWKVTDAKLQLDRSEAGVGECIKGYVDVTMSGVYEDGAEIENRITGYIKPCVAEGPPPGFERAGA